MFECKLVEKISNKTGQPYTAIEITFPGGYTKMVFLTPAEKALVDLSK